MNVLQDWISGEHGTVPEVSSAHGHHLSDREQTEWSSFAPAQVRYAQHRL